MISVIQIAIGEIKLAVRHVSFWIALIFLNILTLVTSNILRVQLPILPGIWQMKAISMYI